MYCTALEDFDYQGRVNLDGNIVKVQIRRGQKAEKEEELIITGTGGFRLVAERL